MFDLGKGQAESLCALVDALGEVSSAAEPRDLLAQVEALERVKCAAAAAQARLTAELDDRRNEAHPLHAASDASLGAEVGLARHQSPHCGRRKLGLARALVGDLPATLAALASGEIDERRAQIICDGTRDLSLEDRRAVNAEIAVELRYLGDRQLQHLVQRVVYRIDEPGAVRRREQAQRRRHVTSRNLGDGTARVTGVVSDVHAAAIMGSLRERADLERAAGVADDRSRGQLVADIFVERLTGQATATAVPVNVDLVVSAETLFGGDDEPADILGCGPVPASVARERVIASPEEQAKIRRLFRFEETDRLVAMESTSRIYRGLRALLIRIRDRSCRTPYCNGDIKHGDHVVPVRDGGETTDDNAQGLCEACNYIKEQPGWRHRVVSDAREQHTVEITTPGGHTIRSRAPDPRRPSTRGEWLEIHPGRWVLAA
jgi:uncharacterized protein DUF222/HNH endonuclease